MSENDNLPPAPSKQTSSVPLKKETVRVTLKAADAPPAVPSATVPMAPPVRPPVPGGAPPVPTAPAMSPPRPSAPAPAPTIPLRPAGAPTPTAAGPAPTIPLRPAGAPTAPAPAPTIRLATAGSPISPGGTTAPLRPPGAPTVGGAPGLPKATVQLQAPTQPLGTSFPSTPSQAATLQLDEEEEEDAGSGLLKVLSGIGLAAALVVLGSQLYVANIWINAPDNQTPGDWSQLLK